MGLAVHEARHGLIAHDAGDQVIGRSLALYGEWAEEEIFLLSHVLRPGDTVLDIGANVGSHALAFGRLVGEGGRVVAIDGQRRASAILALNILLNGVHHVTRIEAVVGQETRVVHLREGAAVAPDGNLGSLSFRGALEAGNAPGPVAMPLPMVTVDSLALPSCRLLKIDVEGMELDVLQGAAGTIARHRPVIYFEQTSGTNFDAIVAMLDGAGYDLRWHVANPFNRNNHRGERVNIFGGTCEVNVLALPRGETVPLPDPVALPPVTGRDYAPPASPTGLEGWRLPPDAYRALPPRPRRPAFACPTDPDAFVDRGAYDLLERQFLDLRRDRIRAQEIMDHQAEVIASIRRDAPLPA